MLCGRNAANSIHIGKFRLCKSTEKNCSETGSYNFGAAKKKSPSKMTGRVMTSDDVYALSILPERRQRVHTYTSSVPPVVVLTLTF